MAKIALKSLDEARANYDEIVNDLKSRYAEHVIYQEILDSGDKRRPIFLLKNQSQIDDVQATIVQLEKLADNIRDLSGYAVRLPLPVLERSVLFYRIWSNTINASATVSRVEIIGKIEKRILAASRHTDETSELLIKHLKKELAFFIGETEQFYRSRSTDKPTTTIKLSKTNGIDSRVKTNDSGTFIVGADFIAPHGETPKTKKPRKKRVSIFDELEPIPYSGAANAILYRESEVEARKQVIGFNADKQEAVKNANKSKSTKRDKA